jgi:hypothetical protein
MTYQPQRVVLSRHRRRNAIIITAAAITGLLVVLGVIGAAIGPPKTSHPVAVATTRAAVPARRATPVVPVQTPHAHSSKPAPARADGHPTYSARVVKPRPYADPTYPDTLDVFFVVTNTSKVAGTPECIISADSPGALHTGTDVLDHMERIGARKTIAMAAQVTITGRARLVTEVFIRCSAPDF